MGKKLPEVVYVYRKPHEFGSSLAVTTDATKLGHGTKVGVYRLQKLGEVSVCVVTDGETAPASLAEEIAEALNL